MKCLNCERELQESIKTEEEQFRVSKDCQKADKLFFPIIYKERVKIWD